MNPIRKLPKGYATYNAKGERLDKAFNDEFESKEDESRDRRLQEGEHERIRAIIHGEKPENQERPMK